MFTCVNVYDTNAHDNTGGDDMPINVYQLEYTCNQDASPGVRIIVWAIILTATVCKQFGGSTFCKRVHCYPLRVPYVQADIKIPHTSLRVGWGV